jgi:hypothetical protein
MTRHQYVICISEHPRKEGAKPKVVVKTLKPNSNLRYDRRSVGQSVLVSDSHLGPATNFSYSFLLILDS